MLNLNLIYTFRPAFGLFLVDPQLQHIRAGVVSHAVQLHAAGGHLLHVQIGVDDGLLVPHGDGGLVAEGVDDTAAAPAGDIRQGGDLRRAADRLGIVLPPEDQVGVDEVAVPLDGDVADGVLHSGLSLVLGEMYREMPFWYSATRASGI